MLEIKNWSLLSNSTVQSVVFIASWLLYKFFFEPRLSMTLSIFCGTLTVELAENRYDIVFLRSEFASDSEDIETSLQLAAGIQTHLAVINKKIKLSRGYSTPTSS